MDRPQVAQPSEVTRLAPSPTGALHLGNARTFLINWALARQNGWRVLMRLEDLDGPRVKPEASLAAIDTLRWLGLDWDGEPVYQSHDLAPYREALHQLRRKGEIYPCKCTRKDLQTAQSAPHADDHELRYPGNCRPAPSSPPIDPDKAILEESNQSWRVHVPDLDIPFRDTFFGEQSYNVQQQVGDFIVASKQGLPAYQLAVVVDDARQGVTQVVRGDDLLGSTSRQVYLYQALGLSPLPTYTHLPLVLGPDGRRLAKRHGDTRISTFREQGVSSERIVGLLAHWSGIGHTREPMSAREFADRLCLGDVPHHPITMTKEDQDWLTDAC